MCDESWQRMLYEDCNQMNSNTCSLQQISNQLNRFITSIAIAEGVEVLIHWISALSLLKAALPKGIQSHNEAANRCATALFDIILMFAMYVWQISLCCQAIPFVWFMFAIWIRCIWFVFACKLSITVWIDSLSNLLVCKWFFESMLTASMLVQIDEFVDAK